MSTALPAHPRTVDDSPPAPADAARVMFRQPVSKSGFIDAAWWPRSRDLTAELPPLLAVLWTASREINRITYNLAGWERAPRHMLIEGRDVRLGGFATGDPITVRLTDAWERERVDILVIAPDTDPETAERILTLASTAENPLRAAEILSRANEPVPGATVAG